MANDLNKRTLIQFLGTKAGTKLYQWLDPCCNQFCLDVQACVKDCCDGSGGGGGGSVSTLGTSLYSTSPLAGPDFNTFNGIFLGQQSGSNATYANDSNFLGGNAGNNATNSSNSNFLGQNAGINATNAYNSNFLGLNTGGGAIYANYSNFLGTFLHSS